MHIICPHCTTSYAIDLATLGAAGRTVRCSRCKEVWLARPEDAVTARRGACHGGPRDGRRRATPPRNGRRSRARTRHGDETPVVDSPSISADWPAERRRAEHAETDWPSIARHDADDTDAGAAAPVLASASCSKPAGVARAPGKPRQPADRLRRHGRAGAGADRSGASTWCGCCRRPRTFYKMVGLEVNLRGLVFKDVKITTETVEGKPVLVIEGVIVGEARKPVELPRLRFSVRDAQGAEIYAWNAVLEQPVLKPGEQRLVQVAAGLAAARKGAISTYASSTSAIIAGGNA